MYIVLTKGKKMQRTQIYLNEQAHLKLTQISSHTGKTISQLIREAIENFLRQNPNQDRLSLLKKGKGIWKDRNDFSEFEKIRKEMNRTF